MTAILWSNVLQVQSKDSLGSIQMVMDIQYSRPIAWMSTRKCDLGHKQKGETIQVYLQKKTKQEDYALLFQKYMNQRQFKNEYTKKKP